MTATEATDDRAVLSDRIRRLAKVPGWTLDAEDALEFVADFVANGGLTQDQVAVIARCDAGCAKR